MRLTVMETDLIQQGIQAIEAEQFDKANKKLTDALSIIRSKENRDLSVEWSILKHLSFIRLQQGNYFQAEDLAQKSLVIAKKLDDRAAISKSLNNLGLVYYWQEKYAVAIAAYREALEYIDRDDLEHWKIWYNLGETYYWQENYDLAIESYSQALEFAKNDDNPLKLSATLSSLGQTYYWANNYPEAIKYLKQGLESTQISNKISILNTLGLAYFSNHEYLEGESIVQQLITLTKEIDDSNQTIKALNLLATIQIELKQFTLLESSATQAIGLATSNDLPIELATAWQNLGIARSQLFNLDGAIEAHERSLAIFRSLQGTQISEIAALMSLGSLHERRGNYAQAISCFEQSFRLAIQIEDNSTAQLTGKNLGQIYLSLGYYQVAIANFQQYLNLAEADENPATDIEAYQKLGDAYHAAGDRQKGITNYQAALTLARKVNDVPQQIKALSNLASGYRALQNYDKAIEYTQQVIELLNSQSQNAPMDVGHALLERIILLTTINDPDVFDACQELLKLCQETSAYPESLALSCLANAHSHRGNYDRAIEILQQALALELKDRQSRGQILNSLAQTYLNAQNFAAAETTAREAISIWEFLRANLEDRDELKVPLLTKQRMTYQLLQTALVSQEKYLEALEVAELGRARSLSDILNQRSLNTSGESQADESIQQADIVKLAQTLNATLVEYSETLEALYIWVIKPSGEIHFEQVALFNPLAVFAETATKAYQSNELTKAVTEIRRAMNISESLMRKLVVIGYDNASIENPQVDLEAALTKVYQFLIEPIENHLPQDPQSKVIFIPQGYLFNVPFSALIDPLGFYLIEKHTIATAPSLQVLSYLRLDRSGSNSLANYPLIVGNPTMPEIPATKGYSLSDLPGAEQEAIAIAKIFEVSPLTGADATKTRVKEQMKTSSIIHFATHGLLDYGAEAISFERNILGAIALAPDRGDNQLEPGRRITYSQGNHYYVSPS